MFRRSQLVKETTLLEEIQNNNMKEQAQKKLEKENRQVWENNRVVYIKERIHVPNNSKIWEQILQENHKPADFGYLEQQKMLELIKRNY